MTNILIKNMLKEKTIYVIEKKDVVSFRGNMKKKRLAVDCKKSYSSKFTINCVRLISNSFNLIELGLYEEYEKGNYDKLPDTPNGIPYPIICLSEKEYNKLKLTK